MKSKNLFGRVYGIKPDKLEFQKIVRDFGERQVLYVLGRIKSANVENSYAHFRAVCSAMLKKYRTTKGMVEFRSDFGGSEPIQRSASVYSTRTRGTKHYTRTKGM
jgi:hypothetical protein